MDNMLKSMAMVLFFFGMVACGSPEAETTPVEETTVESTDTTATGVTVDETTDTNVSVEEVVPVQ